MPKVGCGDADLRSQDDLAVIDRGLGVVGLPWRCALGAHHTGVQVGQVDRAVRQLSPHVGLAVALQPPPERVALIRSPPLIGIVGFDLDLVVLLQPTGCLEQPVLPVAEDRSCVVFAPLLKLSLG